MSRQYRSDDVVIFRGWKWKVVAVDCSRTPKTVDIVCLDSANPAREIQGLPMIEVTFVPTVLA